MSKFRLKNIAFPGRVHLPGGEVNLEDLPEERKEQMYKDGCPYFELTAEGYAEMYPEKKIIKVQQIQPVVNELANQQIKEFLKNKGIPFNHRLGTKKLKALYLKNK